jgi:hypothetical protein
LEGRNLTQRRKGAKAQKDGESCVVFSLAIHGRHPLTIANQIIGSSDL